MLTLIHCLSLFRAALYNADSSPSFLQDPAKQLKPNIMADACQVVNVLGNDVRNHLIERYSAMELKEYRRIFRTTDEAGQLDNIPRRFAWFRRLLQTYELEHGRMFPSEWKVGWHLFAKFVAITRCDRLISYASPKSQSPLKGGYLSSTFQGRLYLDCQIFA